jgi:hypothetical protein
VLRGLFKQQPKRKALMVDDGNYTLVKLFALTKGINVQDATSKLLYYGLNQSLGFDLTRLHSVDAIKSAFKGIKPKDHLEKKRLTVRLILPKAQEKHLIVSPNLHLAVTEFARVKGLKIHEATYFLLRPGILDDAGIDIHNSDKHEDIIGNIYQKINGVKI